MTTIDQVLAKWNSGDGKPYKGSLIDWDRYGGDGDEPPTDIGCMCAQGQVLHLIGGRSPWALKNMAQGQADLETASLLGISRAHAVLLRKINDSVDGAPSIVLTHPEKILGDQAATLLAFWKHIDRMTHADWLKVAAAGDTAWAAAWAARASTWAASRAATWVAAWSSTWAASRAAAGEAAWASTWAASRASTGEAAGVASFAAAEIQGAKLMRERNKPFFFLPMFGFATPEEIPLIRRV